MSPSGGGPARRSRSVALAAGRGVLRYALILPVVAAAMVLLAWKVVDQGPGTPVLVFLLAVLVCARLGGFGPGLASTLLILFVTGTPDNPLWRQLRFGLFLLSGAFISAVVESMHAARRRARAHAETLAGVLRASADPILVLDADGRFLRASDGAAVALGARPEAMVGRTWREQGLPEALMAPLDEAREGAVASGEPARGELAASGPEGPRHFEFVVTPLPVPREGAAVVVARDITDRKRAEEALREADRKKDEFLAMLAHELRNPLAAIASAAEVAHLDPGQVDWSLGVIRRQGTHIARLIEDLLDVSRITRGKVHLRPRVADLSALLNDAVEAARPMIAGRGHRLIVEGTDAPLWAVVDPTRIEQVALNLLTNAARYTESGGEIRLRAGREQECAVFRVSDTGIGFEPGALARMFEPFVQGDRPASRTDAGLGIGLALVRNLVELHGGSVEAESPGPGRGSTFTVRLPATDPPAEGTPSPAPAAGSCGPERSRRILVVDDNEESARGLSRLMALKGHEVRTAGDGPSALEAAREFGPGFILLDLGLPGMDGYSVAASLRADGPGASAVIIAVTGYDRPEDRDRARSAGIDHHLVKPVDHDALLDLVGRG